MCSKGICKILRNSVVQQSELLLTNGKQVAAKQATEFYLYFSWHLIVLSQSASTSQSSGTIYVL